MKPMTHSIINKPFKPAWLKGLAAIGLGLYRRHRTSFADAGDGAIFGAATFSTPSKSDQVPRSAGQHKGGAEFDTEFSPYVPPPWPVERQREDANCPLLRRFNFSA
jgi:hypothetical protein